MKFSIACICGYETPLVENKKDIDYDLLNAHQEFCEVYLALRRDKNEN
tara:strand:+ start:438 stop:581 length:144 start_codon:yes stop_codon:yes gene_type:complete